jgi:hypothetical protein
VLEALNGIADFLLAAAVFGIAYPAVRGWQLEKAARDQVGDKQAVALEDAKTFYALAALQRPYVFWAALIGSGLKMLILIVMAFEYVVTFNAASH